MNPVQENISSSKPIQTSGPAFQPAFTPIDELRKRYFEYCTPQDETLRLDKKFSLVQLPSVYRFPDVLKRIEDLLLQPLVLMFPRVEFTFAELFDYLALDGIDFKGSDVLSILGPIFLSEYLLSLADIPTNGASKLTDWVNPKFIDKVKTRGRDTDIELPTVDEPELIVEQIIEFLVQKIYFNENFDAELYYDKLVQAYPKYKTVYTRETDSQSHHEDMLRLVVKKFAFSKLYNGPEYSIVGFTSIGKDDRNFDIFIPRVKIRTEIFHRDALQIRVEPHGKSFDLTGGYHVKVQSSNPDIPICQVVSDGNLQIQFSGGNYTKKIDKVDWLKAICLNDPLVEKNIELDLFNNAMSGIQAYKQNKIKKRGYTHKKTPIEIRQIKYIAHILKAYFNDHVTSDAAFAYLFRASLSVALQSNSSDSEILELWETFIDKGHLPKQQSNALHQAIRDAIVVQKVPFRTLLAWMSTVMFLYCPKALSKNEGQPYFFLESMWIPFISCETLLKVHNEVRPYLQKNDTHTSLAYRAICNEIIKYKSFTFPSPWLKEEFSCLKLDLVGMGKIAQQWIDFPNPRIKDLGINLLLSLPTYLGGDTAKVLFCHLMSLKCNRSNQELSDRIETVLLKTDLAVYVEDEQRFEQVLPSRITNEQNRYFWIQWMKGCIEPYFHLAASHAYSEHLTGNKWEKDFGLEILQKVSAFDWPLAFSLLEQISKNHSLKLADYAKCLKAFHHSNREERQIRDSKSQLLGREMLKVMMAKQNEIQLLSEVERNHLSIVLEWFAKVVFYNFKTPDQIILYLTEMSKGSLLRPKEKFNLWMGFLNALLEKGYTHLVVVQFYEVLNKGYLTDYGKSESRFVAFKQSLIKKLESNERAKASLLNNPKFVKELLSDPKKEQKDATLFAEQFVSFLMDEFKSAPISDSILAAIEKCFIAKSMPSTTIDEFFSLLLKKASEERTDYIVEQVDRFLLKPSIRGHATVEKEDRVSFIQCYLTDSFRDNDLSSRKNLDKLMESVLDWSTLPRKSTHFTTGRDFLVRVCQTRVTQSNVNCPEYLGQFLKDSQKVIFDSYKDTGQYRQAIDFIYLLHRLSVYEGKSQEIAQWAAEELLKDVQANDFERLSFFLFDFFPHDEMASKQIEAFRIALKKVMPGHEVDCRFIKKLSVSTNPQYLLKAMQLLSENHKSIEKDEQPYEVTLKRLIQGVLDFEKDSHTLTMGLLSTLESVQLPPGILSSIMPRLMNKLSRDTIEPLTRLAETLSKEPNLEPITELMIYLVLKLATDNIKLPNTPLLKGQTGSILETHRASIKKLGCFIEELANAKKVNQQAELLLHEALCPFVLLPQPKGVLNEVSIVDTPVGEFCPDLINKMEELGILHGINLIKYRLFVDLAPESHSLKSYKAAISLATAMQTYDAPYAQYLAASALAAAIKVANAEQLPVVIALYEKLFKSCDKYFFYLVEKHPIHSYLLDGLSNSGNSKLVGQPEIYIKLFDANFRGLKKSSELLAEVKTEFRKVVQCLRTGKDEKGKVLSREEIVKLDNKERELRIEIGKYQKFQCAYLDIAGGCVMQIRSTKSKEYFGKIEQLMPLLKNEVLFGQDRGLSLAILDLIATKSKKTSLDDSKAAAFHHWLTVLGEKKRGEEVVEPLALIEYAESLVKKALERKILQPDSEWLTTIHKLINSWNPEISGRSSRKVI